MTIPHQGLADEKEQELISQSHFKNSKGSRKLSKRFVEIPEHTKTPNPVHFGPGSFRPGSFRPGSFRPNFGVGRFGPGSFRPKIDK